MEPAMLSARRPLQSVLVCDTALEALALDEAA